MASSPVAEDDDADWELVSPEDGLPSKRQAPYRKLVDLELTTRLGTMSFKLESGNPPQATPPQDLPVNEGPKPRSMQEQSPFFRLPAELRLRIYENLLHLNADAPYVKIIYMPGQARPTVLNILQTCHRVHAEAEHIFYAGNRLYIRPGAFLSSLSSRRSDAIARVFVPANSPGDLLRELEKLQMLPNLKSLIISRFLGLRFTDVGPWKLLQAQVSAVLTSFPSLEDFEIRTPSHNNPDIFERDKAAQLASIDLQLKQCALQRHRPS